MGDLLVIGFIPGMPLAGPGLPGACRAPSEGPQLSQPPSPAPRHPPACARGTVAHKVSLDRGTHSDNLHPSQRTPLEGTASPSPCETPWEEQGGDSPHALCKGLGTPRAWQLAWGQSPAR